MAKTSILKAYLENRKIEDVNTNLVAYLASLEKVAEVSPLVAKHIVQELVDQRTHLKLIASENFSSLAVQLTMGNLLTDKYAEGFAFHRFYAGCDNVDAIEAHGTDLAKKLFGSEHAYIQPHSGADANLVAFWAILNTKVQTPMLEELGILNPSDLDDKMWAKVRQATGNQRLLGLDYYSGGHLTHGYRQNISAHLFEAHSYTVDKETGLLDYDAIEKQALELKPLILLAGYSAYPRLIDFKRMSEIAKKSNSVFMVDMAHFAGLVAGKVMTDQYDPIKWADVVTTTTHKTLRGPRGGMVLCKEEFADAVDKGCPMVLGGPLPHMLAAKTVAFTEALEPSFSTYAHKVVENSKALAAALIKEGVVVATGGSDNHLMLIDVRPFNLNGRQAESALRESGITLNRNALPFDPNGPWYTSGLRIGTPAITSLGMGVKEMEEVAAIIKLVLSNTKPTTITKGEKKGELSRARFVTDKNAITKARQMVQSLLERFNLYPELDLKWLDHYRN
ncbi:MAG: glycine hydroxymethyltransferase [Sphaerochaetaceae bacterium]|jgi:glycine hydroxymethyltransferase